MKFAQRVDENPVIESESGEARNDGLPRRGRAQYFVIEFPKSFQKRIRARSAPDSADHFVPLFPFPDKRFQKLGRLLKIRAEADDRIPGGAQKRMKRRADVTKVVGIENHFEFPIPQGDRPEHVPRTVRGAVVRHDKLIIVLGKPFQNRKTALVELLQIFRFIIAAARNADFLHDFSF